MSQQSDPRLDSVSSFTTTRHHTVPDDLRPEQFVLPPRLTVCIIGAGQGIGESIALAYAKAHVSALVLAARTVADLDRVASSIRAIDADIDVLTVSCDVASAKSVQNLAATVQARFGRLDVLVSNAGYAGPVTLKIEEGEPEWVQRAFDVNAMGTYHAAHYFVPLLLSSEDGAKAFLTIGSLAGCIRRGIIANTGYTISKMAQARLVEYVHEQHVADSILAMTIHPGAVNTNMAKGNTPDDFIPYLIDDVGLCGAVCVWVSAHIKDLAWLSGRFISANWDMAQLVAKREAIVAGDLLKFAMVVD